MAHIPRTLRIAGQSVVVVAALGMAAILVVPRLLGWDVVTVLSGSMAPTYPRESVLALASVDPADVEVGDVVAFLPPGSDGTLVTHRVVAVQRADTGLAFVTQGDANDDPDLDPVAAASLRGRVVFGVPHLGWLVRVARSPIGVLCLLLVPGALVIGHEIRSIREALRERRGPQPITPATHDLKGSP